MREQLTSYPDNRQLNERVIRSHARPPSEVEGTDNIIDIPRSEGLAEAWKDLQNRYPDDFIVSAKEWVACPGEDLAVNLKHEQGQEWTVDVTVYAEADGPRP